MKKTIIAALLALGILIAGAPPAVASEHVITCGDWSHGSGVVRGCVLLERNQDVLRAVWKGRETDAPTTGFYRVTIDWLRLKRDGVTIFSQEGDYDTALSSNWFYHVTQWSTQTGTYQASARYQFKHMPDGHLSGWITRTTGTFNF
jgi:hypothetical protein